MIKLFRNARRSLVNQAKSGNIIHDLFSENRINKYLAYAIGEILLVVIGILIALQINNWNEDRKSVQLELKILKEIQAELVLALEDLKDDISDHQRNLNSARIVYRSLLHRENYHDSLRRHYLLMLDPEKFTVKESAFESLKSIGLSTISNDSIRQAITDVYLYTKEINIKVSDNDNRKIDELAALLAPHLRIDRERILGDPKLADRISWGFRNIPFTFIDYDAFLKDEQFLYTLTVSMQWKLRQIGTFKRFEQRIEKVIADIGADLERLGTG